MLNPMKNWTTVKIRQEVSDLAAGVQSGIPLTKKKRHEPHRSMLSQSIVVNLSHWLAERGSEHTFDIRYACGQHDHNDETEAPCFLFSMVAVLSK